ncbi:hypothetical protein RDI58_003041 [Solanum bulbocastanum]|uniref:Uncharacterized protein n=1 Tax=Solanum bulbocastanum TaxID=147425 RepID=A0AAN8UGQ7_SOLBU
MTCLASAERTLKLLTLYSTLSDTRILRILQYEQIVFSSTHHGLFFQRFSFLFEDSFLTFFLLRIYEGLQCKSGKLHHSERKKHVVQVIHFKYSLDNIFC